MKKNEKNDNENENENENEVTNENPNEKNEKIILNISNLWLDANHINLCAFCTTMWDCVPSSVHQTQVPV